MADPQLNRFRQGIREMDEDIDKALEGSYGRLVSLPSPKRAGPQG